MAKERKGGYQFLMKPKFLSWNVGGLNDGGINILKVRNLLRKWKVDIVSFQEIKLEFASCSVVRGF